MTDAKFIALQKYRLGSQFVYSFPGWTPPAVADYFIEVDSVSIETSQAVTRSLMAMFSRYAVPGDAITDNGPYFGSSEFVKFADV